MTSTTTWHGRLAATGRLYRDELAPLVDAADREGRVSPASRLLCAALSQLARSCYSALGGSRHTHAVGRAAALLSLLTKIDDQIIDNPDCHGGEETDRRSVRARVSRYLAPTLASIRSASPATDEPRCETAAELGRQMRSLSGFPGRLEHLLELIARGWDIQAEAVAIFSSHPGRVGPDEVARVTANISGAWLLMITMVGTLPDDVSRPLTADEEAAYFDWGLHIQRADALADLSKDVAEGLISSYPGHRIWQRAPEEALCAFRCCDAAGLYELLHTWDIDLACLPTLADTDTLSHRLRRLGEVPSLLRWIHGFLLWRYLSHDLCLREPSHEAFARHTGPRFAWGAYGERAISSASFIHQPRGSA